MKIFSSRDSLHEKSNYFVWNKIRKVSSNILSAEIAQRVVMVIGTFKISSALTNFLFKNDTFNFLLNKDQ